MGFMSNLLFVVGILVVSSSWTTSQSPDNPRAEHLRRGCGSDTDCREDEYCGGKSFRCIECFDCQSVQRSPKKGYDGSACARHSTECGECNPGYKEMGGVCVPSNYAISSSHLTTPPPIHVSNDFRRLDGEEDLKEGSFDWTLVCVVSGIVVTFVLIGGAVVIGRKKGLGLKRGNTSDEEETTLYNGSPDNASAPPDEYARQPPSYTPPRTNPYMEGVSRAINSPFFPQTTMERSQLAAPFSRGNGAGNWNVTNESGGQTNAGDNGNRQPQNQRIRHVHAEGPGEDQTDSPGTVGTPRNESSGGGNGSSASPQRENMSRQSTGERQSAPRHSYHQAMAPSNNNLFDPILGTIGVVFRMEMPAIFPTFFSEQAGTRFVASAPASPRRIDDTHLNLSSLSGSFVPSHLNNSLVDGPINFVPNLHSSFTDSGTGTGDQSVPSAAQSDAMGGLSDTEMDMDSMFDEESFPAALNSQVAPPPVPDFSDQVRLGESMMLNQMELPRLLHYSAEEVEE